MTARSAGSLSAELVSLLDTLGFAPELDDDRPHAHPEGGPSQIRLRNCPFLELASSKPQIACSIHLGLMRGALDAWGSPVTVDRLDPFAEPDLCVAHLTREGARCGTGRRWTS